MIVCIAEFLFFFFFFPLLFLSFSLDSLLLVARAEFVQDGVGELCRGCLSAEISRQVLSFPEDGEDGALDLLRQLLLSDVLQHHCGAQ